MDNPDEHYFLIEHTAMRFNPLQEGELIACQTFPPPRKAWRENYLSVQDLVYRGFDLSQAREAARIEDLGRDCSSAGVCQFLNGRLQKIAYDGLPYENLEKPGYFDDEEDFDDEEEDFYE